MNTAQVCLKGHIINWYANLLPSENRMFCGECGGPCITNCLSCSAPIEGGPDGGRRLAKPAAFCGSCGNAYPWTEEKLERARFLIDEVEGVDSTDKKQVAIALSEIAHKKSVSSASVKRIQSFFSGPAKEVANAIKEIMIDVAGEFAKKIIWPT